MKDKILVIGSAGQIGTELLEALRAKYGTDNVVAADLKKPEQQQEGPFEQLDVTDKQRLGVIVAKHEISQIYLLAALLSATAEKNPMLAWKLNMEGLLNVLELGREKRISRIFWPSSIAVFGPNSPKEQTPQYTVMEPTTVYGISKLAGERWCEYYFNTYGVDVRSLRYPGLIGWKSAPGGGTTDYAVHIYHEALKSNSYECFLGPETTLPMMYLPEAIKATLSLMDADPGKVKIRSSYNLAGTSFSPKEIAGVIKEQIPGFRITYKPDYRQKIADTWPHSIDDSSARHDWGWEPLFNLERMSAEMIGNLKKIMKNSCNL
jgi:nucleoside-diphosphate-sugar epimerase